MERNDWTQLTKLLLIIAVGVCVWKGSDNGFLGAAAAIALFTFA